MIRKPHNLVTSYWDDSEYFSNKAGALVPRKIDNSDYLSPEEKRAIRYAILSSFLFLEAFINAEYCQAMGFYDPSKITKIQMNNLDEKIIETNFEDKWSKWIEQSCEQKCSNLKGQKEFQNIKRLKDWRNDLTHYKIHNLTKANIIETIDNARQANQIAIGALKWYYSLTKKQIPAWIDECIFKKKLPKDDIDNQLIIIPAGASKIITQGLFIHPHVYHT